MIISRSKLYLEVLTTVYVIEVRIDSGAIPWWKWKCVAIRPTTKTELIRLKQTRWHLHKSLRFL